MSEKLFYDIMNEHYRYCEYCKHSSNTVCKPCMESDYRKNFELDKDYLFSIGEVIEICEDYRQIANMRDYMHSKDTAMYNKRIFDEEAFFMILDMYYASCEYCKYYMSNKENETCKNCIDKELWDFRRNFRMNMAYQFDVGEVMRICKLYHEYKNMVSDCVANNEIREALERYDASEKGLNRKEFMEELERW